MVKEMSSRSGSSRSPKVIKKVVFSEGSPKLCPHLVAERLVFGQGLESVLDQLRGHEGQNADDARQVTPGGVGTLDPLQLTEEEIRTRLRVRPLHGLDDGDAFLPM